MANPQWENGHVKIAHDLFGALARAHLSGLEKDVVLAVIYFTYGSGKSKAQIDIQDLQVFITGERRVRADRVEAAIDKLVDMDVLYRQRVNQGTPLLGVQKDFDKWGAHTEKVDKMSALVAKATKGLLTNKPITKLDKMSTLIEYAHKGSFHNLSVVAYGVEKRNARLLYQEALELTRDPAAAGVALKDFIDTASMTDFWPNTKMRMVYLAKRFKAWYKLTPAKPRNIREQEDITGMRYLYNLRTKQWEAVDEKRV